MVPDAFNYLQNNPTSTTNRQRCDNSFPVASIDLGLSVCPVIFFASKSPISELFEGLRHVLNFVIFLVFDCELLRPVNHPSLTRLYRYPPKLDTLNLFEEVILIPYLLDAAELLAIVPGKRFPETLLESVGQGN
jgi:hypothetical protein